MSPTGALTGVEQGTRSIGRSLAASHPRLEGPITEAWDRYVRTYIRASNTRANVLHARHTTIDPYELVPVDPARVEYLIDGNGLPSQARPRQRLPKPKYKYAGTVLRGDWDLDPVRFDETELYRGFEAHFERGVDWSETAFFETVIGYIERGIDLWGCSTRREFEQRCQDLDALYEVIERHGFLSQAELAAASFEDPVEKDRGTPTLEFVNDEVALCIGRNGGLFFVDGRDRLAIAKVLGLEEIPVWIMARHVRWQEFREAVAANPSICADLSSRLRSHPDLRGICSPEEP